MLKPIFFLKLQSGRAQSKSRLSTYLGADATREDPKSTYIFIVNKIQNNVLKSVAHSQHSKYNDEIIFYLAKFIFGLFMSGKLFSCLHRLKGPFPLRSSIINIKPY